MDEPISNVINTSNVSKEHTYNLDGESFSGYGGAFGLSRETENWETRYYFATKSPNYRSDLGLQLRMIGKNIHSTINTNTDLTV